jgi:hypothetical protein
MLNAGEWAELAVFEHHIESYKSAHREISTNSNESIVINYFEERIKLLKKKK